jgi:hypothetical protein
MTNPDDIQRDLGGLLADVTPSTTFAARVRTRVAEDAARGSRRAVYAWALGGAVCLASLGWVLTAHRSAATPIASAPATVSAALVGQQAPAVPIQPRARTERPQGSRRVRLDAPQPTPADVETLSVQTGDGRVLVPDDQRIALVHLLLRLHQGRATVPASIVPAYDQDGLLIPPEPVVIAPLPNPAPPDSPDSDSAGGGRLEPGKAGRDKQR